jgi:hypothetical protein
VSVYSTPPKNARDLLDFLASCVQEYMEHEHEDFDNEDMPENEDELISADPYFASGEYGVGMIVGPFRDGKDLYSFVVKIDGITKIT